MGMKVNVTGTSYCPKLFWLVSCIIEPLCLVNACMLVSHSRHDEDGMMEVSDTADGS